MFIIKEFSYYQVNHLWELTHYVNVNLGYQINFILDKPYPC